MKLPGIHWLPAATIAAVIFWLSHQSDVPGADVPVPDWGAHAIEYGVFTATLVYGLTRGFVAGLRTRLRVVAAVGIAALYGITDEIHQSFVPGRESALHDWVSDLAGALLMGALILLAWSRMARPKDRL